jgi:hypothetical protein
MCCNVCHGQIGDTFVSIASLKMHIQCYEGIARCIICDRKCFDKINNMCLLCEPITSVAITVTPTVAQNIIYDPNGCPKCGNRMITRSGTKCFGITGYDYDVDVTMCPKCDP